MLKTLGYLISSVSVTLLGIVAWSGASEHPALMGALILGMAASVLGMLLRWLSFRQDQRDKRRIESEAHGRRTG
jgi:hypothetical protein